MIASRTTLSTGYTVYNGTADVLLGDGLDGALDEARIASADKSGDFFEVETTYAYNARNQLTASATGETDVTYEYDNNGNQTKVTQKVDTTTIAESTYAYDALNRVTSIVSPTGTETFTYRGAEWHRSSMTSGGVTTTFLYDGDNVVADLENGTMKKFYVTPFLDQNVSVTFISGETENTYYYSQDGLGSVRTLTDENEVVKNTYDYTAFGETYAPNTAISVENRYTYTSQELNPVSDTMFYNYRTYLPGLGRFSSADPIGYAGGINLYAYVGNRPNVMIDTDGRIFGEHDDSPMTGAPDEDFVKNTVGKVVFNTHFYLECKCINKWWRITGFWVVSYTIMLENPGSIEWQRDIFNWKDRIVQRAWSESSRFRRTNREEMVRQRIASVMAHEKKHVKDMKLAHDLADKKINRFRINIYKHKFVCDLVRLYLEFGAGSSMQQAGNDSQRTRH